MVLCTRRTNDATLPLVASILKAKNIVRLPAWLGVNVGMWEQEGEMLLGSPIGATIAFLLLQHKKELGVKQITNITVFRNGDWDDNDSIRVNMAFTIKTVPEPDDPGVEMGGMRVRQTQARKDEKGFVRLHEFRLDGAGKVQLDSQVMF